MNLKMAKRICDRQGIVMHVQVKILCPRCNKKSLLLDLTDNKACCIRCHKEYKSIEEVDRIEEEKWLDKHKGSNRQMRDNRGVK